MDSTVSSTIRHWDRPLERSFSSTAVRSIGRRIVYNIYFDVDEKYFHSSFLSGKESTSRTSCICLARNSLDATRCLVSSTKTRTVELSQVFRAYTIIRRTNERTNERKPLLSRGEPADRIESTGKGEIEVKVVENNGSSAVFGVYACPSERIIQKFLSTLREKRSFEPQTIVRVPSVLRATWKPDVSSIFDE